MKISNGFLYLTNNSSVKRILVTTLIQKATQNIPLQGSDWTYFPIPFEEVIGADFLSHPEMQSIEFFGFTGADSQFSQGRSAFWFNSLHGY
jgi:hypothetical protein